MTPRIQIIVNPAAGSGKAKRIAESLPEKFSTVVSEDFRITFTDGKDHATIITRDAIKKGFLIIVAVGGDGTINEVANGFMEEGRSINPLCELGIISCGTGRGFSNSMNLPEDLDRQLEIIRKPGFREIDLGLVKFRNLKGEPLSRYFVNECQTGIGSRVASLVGKKHKIFGGPLAFGISATIQAIMIKPSILFIEFDDEAAREFRLIGFVAGNGTECAGGMKLTPDALPDDGLLDVLLMHHMSVPARLMNLAKVYSGNHIHSPFFSVRKCKKVKVFPATSESLEADGEMLGYSPFEFHIIPHAIKIKK